jgi:Response regulator containing a CheY-like receiver domain and an HTH DNA-binding domain
VKDSAVLAIILVVQSFCAVFFVFDIVASVLGLRARPISWQIREVIELGAALGLILGVIVGGLALRRSMIRRSLAENKLRRAASAFADVMEERFSEWGLTPAEREVALFLIKGFPIAEIARLRETSEGTVKAQTNAVYRKAGVNGASQLLSLFLDNLMEDRFLPEKTPEQVA